MRLYLAPLRRVFVFPSPSFSFFWMAVGRFSKGKRGLEVADGWCLLRTSSQVPCKGRWMLREEPQPQKLRFSTDIRLPNQQYDATVPRVSHEPWSTTPCVKPRECYNENPQSICSPCSNCNTPTLPQINMEAHRGPYIEDSSLEGGSSPLPCNFGGVYLKELLGYRHS